MVCDDESRAWLVADTFRAFHINCLVVDSTALLCLPVAPPLTPENVMTVVKGVKRWRALAKQLVYAYDKDGGIYWSGSVDLDDLQHQHGSAQDCLEAIVKVFLQERGGQYEQPTWRAIIWSLYKANETELADQFRSYAEPVKGESMYLCMYSRDCLL